MKELDQHGNEKRRADTQHNDVLDQLEILPQCRIAAADCCRFSAIIKFGYHSCLLLYVRYALACRSSVRYALACRRLLKKTPLPDNDKLKHIGHSVINRRAD